MNKSYLLILCLVFFIVLPFMASAAIPPAVSPVGMYTIPDSAPARIATDSKGKLYVTDPDRGLVSIYSNNGVLVGSIEGIRSPMGIAVDSDGGKIFVSDLTTKSVGAYDRDGTALFMLGGGNGEFLLPNDIALSKVGNIYVADSMANVVKIYSPAGAYLFSIGSGLLSFPTDVTIVTTPASTEEVYVVDHNNIAIRIYDLNGGLIKSISGGGGMFGGGKILRPLGIDVSGEYIYVADAYHSVVAVYHRGGLFLEYVGEYGDQLGQLKTPTDVVIDGNGKMYVTNTNNQRIEIFGIDSFSDLQVDPATLNFSVYANSSPVTQTVELTSSGGSTGWTADVSDAWISLSVSSGATPASVDVTANPYGLPLGTHTAKVKFITPSGTESLLVVNLEVKKPPVPVLGAAPGSLHFVYQQNSQQMNAETVAVSSSFGTLSWTASTSQRWLTLDKTSGSTPASVKVMLNSGVNRLSVGSYTAAVTISASGAAGSPATVTILLDVIKAGNIKVTTNLDEAGFGISGPASFAGGGIFWSAENVAPGTYTISFAHVSGYNRPPTRTFTVESGRTADVNGLYKEKPVATNIIAGSGGPDSNTVAVLSLDGIVQGSFTPFGSSGQGMALKIASVVPTAGIRVLSGDMDGDGIDEIIAVNGINSVKVFSPTGTELAGYALNGVNNLRAAASDIDGDGKTEVILSYVVSDANKTEISAFGLNGNLLIKEATILSVQGQRDLSVAAGDVNGNGYRELVVASKSQIRAYQINTGQPVMLWSRLLNGTVAPEIATGDINDDGIDEIVFGLGPDAANDAVVTVLNGNGTDYGLVIDAFTGYKYGANVALGDTDGDGASEMAAGAGPGSVNEALVNLFGNNGEYIDTIKALETFYGVSVSFGKLAN